MGSPEVPSDDLGVPSVYTADDGTRRVRWKVDQTSTGPQFLEHACPDALAHYYVPRGIGEDLPLYQGAFCLNGDARPFEGDVRFRWLPRPHIEARGSRATSDEDIQRMLEGPIGFWVPPAAVRVCLDTETIPPPPTGVSGTPQEWGHSVNARIEQELGSPNDLDRVTFLVPNGWTSYDGLGICDPDDRTHFWPGRIDAVGDGWAVTIDRVGEMDQGQWRALADTGASRFTHVGSVERVDGASFTGRQAFDVLARVRVALNLALGRRTTCALPVGWRSENPVWARWTSAPVDLYTSRSHWLDDTIAASQVSQIVGRVLEGTSDPVGWSAIRPAVAYYTSANSDVDVELTVGIPVSGLQLLAYYRFVTQRRAYSKRKWLGLDAEDQLRRLLNEVGTDLAVKEHFEHLAGVGDRLALKSAKRDALGVVMKMRNVVTHPTNPMPAEFSSYEWAEAGMHARYWLCLAILHAVGYQGEIADVLGSQPGWTGKLRSVPWASDTQETPRNS